MLGGQMSTAHRRRAPGGWPPDGRARRSATSSVRIAAIASRPDPFEPRVGNLARSRDPARRPARVSRPARTAAGRRVAAGNAEEQMHVFGRRSPLELEVATGARSRGAWPASGADRGTACSRRTLPTRVPANVTSERDSVPPRAAPCSPPRRRRDAACGRSAQAARISTHLRRASRRCRRARRRARSRRPTTTLRPASMPARWGASAARPRWQRRAAAGTRRSDGRTSPSQAVVVDGVTRARPPRAEVDFAERADAVEAPDVHLQHQAAQSGRRRSVVAPARLAAASASAAGTRRADRCASRGRRCRALRQVRQVTGHLGGSSAAAASIGGSSK